MGYHIPKHLREEGGGSVAKFSLEDYVRMGVVRILGGGDKDEVFRDEPILPRKGAPALPEPLRKARQLEQGASYLYQNRRTTFLKQGKLLADYEDDVPILTEVHYYYPTYEILTDTELRSYFSWRTQVRRGNIQRGSTSFAFLYLYELINQIGVSTPLDGLQKMDAFVAQYQQLNGAIVPYCKNWRLSYILYYNLSDSFLHGAQQDAQLADAFAALDAAPERSGEEVVQAVLQIAPSWLGRSKFYRTHQADMDRVIAGVLRGMCLHYRKRGGRTLCDQLFGGMRRMNFELFSAAIFCDPLHQTDGTYYLSDDHYYTCQDGYWTETGRFLDAKGRRNLENLMKAIDAALRAVFQPERTIQCPAQNKWVEKLIGEEIQALRTEKEQAAQAAKRVAINYAALDKIRRDAAITQEKLKIEDELEEEAPPPPPPAAEPEPAGDCPLDKTEYRLMQCLLYGGDTGWVQREGKMLSVLLDSINEKLYDAFQDTVVSEDGPVEDYLDELKEMIRP